VKVGLVQLTATDSPAENLGPTQEYIAQAAAQGAEFILTPEVTNCISLDRARQNEVLQSEEDDQSLQSFRHQANELGIWLMIGSLGIKTGDSDGRFANRCFLINPTGDIIARYDKIHMFDVHISETESFMESKGYRPGEQAVIAQTDFGAVGLSSYRCCTLGGALACPRN